MITDLELSDEELIRVFIDTTLPIASFRHREHVRVAWLFVRHHGMPGALDAFSDALRRFAAAKGADNLFHATITWAYLLLINERHRRQPAASWEEFASRNSDLLAWKPSVLDALYAPDVLWSDFARHTFVMPHKD